MRGCSSQSPSFAVCHGFSHFKDWKSKVSVLPFGPPGVACYFEAAQCSSWPCSQHHVSWQYRKIKRSLWSLFVLVVWDWNERFSFALWGFGFVIWMGVSKAIQTCVWAVRIWSRHLQGVVSLPMETPLVWVHQYNISTKLARVRSPRKQQQVNHGWINAHKDV